MRVSIVRSDYVTETTETSESFNLLKKLGQIHYRSVSLQ